MSSTEDIINKYSKKLETDIGNYQPQESFSRDYLQFKKDTLNEISRYEKWCKSLGSIISLKIAEKDRLKIQKHIDIGHIDATPSQVVSLSLISMLGVFFATILIAVAAYFINGSIQTLFGVLGLITSMFIFYYTYSMPQRLANAWRLKASSQMVPAILYVVVYMKHTSNLERAIKFASEHLEGPLALDFKKIFYDVEIYKFSTLKQSLDNYLETWRDYSPEFIESVHLIESSLFETSESRRIEILEKSLQVILDGIYEKMLKYSREIRTPLTNLYMLGIILPTLGLALLPLASTLLGGVIQWQHVFVIFNLIIPFFVFYMTSEVLLKRPGGYGETSVLELNPDYDKFKSRKPYIISFLICFPLLIIGILPFIFQVPFITDNLGIQSDYTFGELGFPYFADTKLFDFKCETGSAPPCGLEEKKIGPFGPLAVILSLFIPLSIALFFAFSYSFKTKELIKSREKTKILEEEFTNSLFQLGNRLGDGIPAEIVFSRVAESTQGQQTSEFFRITNQNIQQLGMPIDKAIFDPKRGAIIFFPSSLIATSMRILIESVKKGLHVAARSLMSISEYVKNIQKINLRLRDLLAEVVSDMRSNMTFLAPLLAGIVVGLSAMITIILTKLQALQGTTSGEGVEGFGSLSSIINVFDVTKMIPPYFIQLTVGLYLIEIIFILTATLVTVDSGKDTLKEKYDLSKFLKAGLFLYTITSLIAILALTILASIALGTLAG